VVSSSRLELLDVLSLLARHGQIIAHIGVMAQRLMRNNVPVRSKFIPLEIMLLKCRNNLSRVISPGLRCAVKHFAKEDGTHFSQQRGSTLKSLQFAALYVNLHHINVLERKSITYWSSEIVFT
jgi:hypothetical protein